VRILHGLSRYEETPDTMVIELTDDGYIALGSKAEVAEQEARKAILETLPETESDAVATKTLIDEVGEAGVKRTTAQRVLKRLFEDEKLISRTGSGKRGHPFRYWREIDSAQGGGGWAEMSRDEYYEQEEMPI